jgi:hypothetical protein
MIVLFSQFGFDFFSAGRAFHVLKKLKLQAPLVFALDHQGFAAPLAGILRERPAAAVGARYVQRPPAAGADSVAFLDDAQAGRAVITEGAVTAAFGAEARIRVDQLAAVHAGLFIERHRFNLHNFHCTNNKR